jgi:hypothetical protein
VYEEFRNYFDLECQSIKPIEYNTFYKLWKQLTPYIKFQTPGTDLCDTCEAFKRDIRFTNDDDEKENIELEYRKHQTNAERERSHYNKIIEKSKMIQQYHTFVMIGPKVLQLHFLLSNLDQFISNPLLLYSFLVYVRQMMETIIKLYNRRR